MLAGAGSAFACVNPKLASLGEFVDKSLKVFGRFECRLAKIGHVSNEVANP